MRTFVHQFLMFCVAGFLWICLSVAYVLTILQASCTFVSILNMFEYLFYFKTLATLKCVCVFTADRLS